MTYTTGITSPRDEVAYNGSVTYASVRPIGSGLSSRPTASSSSAERASLQRRFTTNAVPTVPTLSTLSPLSPIGQQRRQAAEALEYNGMLQKKRRDEDLEAIRQRQRALQTEMALLNLQEDQLQNQDADANRYKMAGHQSEPTTPPEYAGFPNPISRPNRLSLASMSSLSGQRAGRSGSNVGLGSTYQGLSTASGSASRRGSDEEEDVYDMTSMPRRKNPHNRMSMPITSHDLRSIGEIPDVAAVLGTGLHSILNDDEEEKPMFGHVHSKSMIDAKSTLRMDTTHDAFPILVRDNPARKSWTNPSGLDYESIVEQASWGTATRHRPGQASLPMNSMRDDLDAAAAYEAQVKANKLLNRRSLDVKFAKPSLEITNKRLSLHASPPGMPKLQASYSTNDIPTLKNLNGLNSMTSTNGTNTPRTHAEQHLQQHNAALGRIPPSALNRLSRDLSNLDLQEKTRNAFTSALQPGAAPFATGNGTSTNSSYPNTTTTTSPPSSISAQAYNGYNYPVPVVNLGQLTQNGSPQHYVVQPQYAGMYNNHTSTANNQPVAPSRNQDSQARVIHQRRQQNAEDNARAANFKLEEVRGRIVELSKDQHGCRFLQRKIEERDPEAFVIIFEEAKDSIVDLMTDPFGNYLCQKLLEFSDVKHRTILINNAAPYMVRVAFNQHGTRALQKMIEFIDSEEQIATIIRAFDGQVVPLIQDLNGNHVIQKCLNHLHPRDAQFIFDAVGENCYIVGTHRHGCCVLQRCIDHAAGDQKAELIRQITTNAYPLVKDAFGNYVVQYILDLNHPDFTQPLCLGFKGNIKELARQKFSSNVIEKCIRVADPATRRILVEELMLDPHDMDKFLRDNFANYVVQTALDHSDKDQQDRLWDIVIPLLAGVRGTPCGRRLMGKLQAREKNGGGGGVTGVTGGGNMNINTNVNHGGGMYRNGMSNQATTAAAGGGGGSFNNNISNGYPIYANAYGGMTSPNGLRLPIQGIPLPMHHGGGIGSNGNSNGNGGKGGGGGGVTAPMNHPQFSPYRGQQHHQQSQQQPPHLQHGQIPSVMNWF